MSDPISEHKYNICNARVGNRFCELQDGHKDDHYTTPWDSLKPRPDQRPSDERFPTPWTFKESFDFLRIIDREGDDIAAVDAPDDEYWVKSAAMPFIVHRVNSFDSLLEACRATLRRGCNCASPTDEDWHSYNRPIPLAKTAIESAEKQP